jgi:large subunit ribosomal protein L15
MVNRRRKKVVKYRGSKTHGSGAMKKRRGGGNRGGRGNAGSGKRSDARKPSFWGVRKGGKDPAKRGFASYENVPKTINVGHLSSIADALVRSGDAKGEGALIVIDLGALGYGKLLGAGHVVRKIRVTVASASPGAKEKIEAAGGVLEAATIVDKEKVISDREAQAKAGREKRRKRPDGAKKEEKAAVAEE